jgi:arylsulfatase A-like enzyme
VPRAVLSSLSRDGWPDSEAIVQDGWKYIRSSFGIARPRESLFHLGSDPAELENAANSRYRKRAALSSMLNQQLAGYASDVQPEIHVATDEKLDELRSLGYLK